jgi:hypothetical protein
MALILLAFAANAQTAPRIVDVNPSTVFVGGGTPMIVLYEGKFSQTPTATIDGVSAPAKETTPGIVTVTAPKHASGVAELELRGASGETATATLHYYSATEDWMPLMLPIAALNVPGANGSLWTTESVLVNLGADSIDVLRVFPFPINSTHVTAGARQPLDFVWQQGAGALIWVPRWALGSLAVNSRVVDVSRQSQTWGTELPVLRCDQLATAVTQINVPTDPRFRDMLRVYIPNFVSFRFRVIGKPMVGDETLFDITRDIQLPHLAPPDVTPGLPASAAISLETLPNFRAADRLRLTITADLPIWAFVSVTNNETQHVTLVTPQPR